MTNLLANAFALSDLRDELNIQAGMFKEQMELLASANAELRARNEAMAELLEEFRDTVLNQRGALAENGMTNDQINDVLGEFDVLFAALKERTPS